MRRCWSKRGLGFLTARHAYRREYIKYLIFFAVDKLKALGVQPNKMSAILPVLVPQAAINAEQIRVCAIKAFAEGNTNLRDRGMA